MTKTVAIKELLLEEMAALKLTKEEVFEFFMKQNWNINVIEYIQKLWDYSKEIAGNMIAIGKIVLYKIIKFIKENPNMVFGMALGAIAGALAGLFIGWIPFIGQTLHVLAIAAGTLIGALSGNRLDRISNGEQIDNSVLSIFGDSMIVAKKFIALFMEIIQVVRDV